MSRVHPHLAREGSVIIDANGGDPSWYRDALIYQLHVKAFRDSNGDGTGDFIGLTESLDYIRDLGVDTIWLLPFYPSPLRDDGYDIAITTACTVYARAPISATHARGASTGTARHPELVTHSPTACVFQRQASTEKSEAQLLSVERRSARYAANASSSRTRESQ